MNRRSTMILCYREFRRLHRRALRAQQHDQSEVAGVLLMAVDRPGLLRLAFLENRAQSPGQWRLTIDDIRECERQARAQRLRRVGLFHSHPIGDATLGRRDIRNTPKNWLHLVYDVCASQARLYRVQMKNNRRVVKEVDLQVRRVPQAAASVKQ